jgi:hypothetical protein
MFFGDSVHIVTQIEGQVGHIEVVLIVKNFLKVGKTLPVSKDMGY